MTEKAYLNDPTVVVKDYLTETKEGLYDADLKAAIEVLARYPDRDSLGICIDLAAKPELFAKVTPVLAELFNGDWTEVPENWQGAVLPEHWRSNPEIMRTVLSMAASIDLGYLTALIFRNRGDDSGEPDLRRERLQGFLDKLQEEQSPPMGESAGSLQ